MRSILAVVCLGLALSFTGCASQFSRTIRARWLTEAANAEAVPLRISDSNHIFVRGSVGEDATEMLVDSGAGLTVLDRAYARKLGLREFGRIRVSGVGGHEIGRYVRVPRIRVGEFELRNLLALTLDLSPIALRMDEAIPVILGRELFAATVVEIDYPRQRLVLHRRSGFRYSGAGNTVPLRGSALKTVACAVEGGPPAWFLLDTGSGKSISMFEEYTAEHGLLEDRSPRSTRISGGVGGFAEETVASFASFTFAGYELRDVPARFPTPEAGAFVNKPHAGNLGAVILKRFRLWIDFGRNRMHVEPGPDLAAPFRKDRLGLVALPRDGALRVILAAPGSPAARAGLRKGMTIVQVDGHGGAPVQLRRRLRAAARQAEGTQVHLRVGDGKDYRIELTTHYRP